MPRESTEERQLVIQKKTSVRYMAGAESINVFGRYFSVKFFFANAGPTNSATYAMPLSSP